MLISPQRGEGHDSVFNNAQALRPGISFEFDLSPRQVDLTIIPYEDDADAISIANDTDYGLSALVLGKSSERCMDIARQIDSGRVLINTLAHEPRAPFGGFKHSGPGREMGRWRMSAYLEPKTLVRYDPLN